MKSQKGGAKYFGDILWSPSSEDEKRWPHLQWKENYNNLSKIQKRFKRKRRKEDDPIVLGSRKLKKKKCTIKQGKKLNKIGKKKKKF